MYRYDMIHILQGDQLYMGVFFWYLIKIDLSSVRYCIHIQCKLDKSLDKTIG